MSVPDFLDVCYMLIVEDLKARLLADRQIVGMAQVMGADVEMPDINEELATFSKLLESPPAINLETEERQILKRALGLRS